MRVAPVLGIALLVLALTPGCHSSSSQPPAAAPSASVSASAAVRAATWTEAPVSGFPKPLTTVIGSTYAGGQWFVLAEYAPDGDENPVDVLSSADGRSWHDVAPPKYQVSQASVFGYPQPDLARYRDTAYLLGGGGKDAPKIWSSKGGTFGDPIPLDDTAASSGDTLPVGLATSNDCLYAGVLVYPRGSVKHMTVTFVYPVRFELWSMCGGELAAEPAILTFPDGSLTAYADVHLAVDRTGVEVIVGRTAYRARSGTLAKAATIDQTGNMFLGNGHTVVGLIADGGASVAGQGADDSGARFWSTDGDGVLPVGKPDAGTAPRSQQGVVGGCADQAGFVIAGLTSPDGKKEVAAMWSSADGVHWSKLPQRANHMDKVAIFEGAACSPAGDVLLFGYDNAGTKLPPMTVWTGTMPR